ncbi:flagellar biosynthesis protein FlhF [Falcatimonas sp. MSJ-15]|uniref:flagellar biosynthesis protein FlhF n=1 Tax=Falcatimonas sp. MSJ-15 TaxID=2841515 RepID=UPI001C100C22|nr:flagellar biosynthesis protein FlhF [Falcatimonas sp. MSJ-15]MBU5469650.1 flagellar biosynthesis protein FlhF [Falcatimonas sp. MSJ-15]
MIVKKFQGATENDAILLAKDELGPDAVVLNIKTMKQRGVFRMFKKDFVEITAAVEEKKEENTSNEKKFVIQEADSDKVDAIEEKLDSLHNMLRSRLEEDKTVKNVETLDKKEEPESVAEDKVVKTENKNEKYLSLIRKVLVENEVTPEYAEQIISEVGTSLKKETVIDSILAAVYQKIVLKLGEPENIILNKDKPVVAFFAGPTGVGKTTTIAKIASTFKLTNQARVALITSDTYRIAAVEQLTTYASILSVPIKVVYTPLEMKEAIDEFADYDLILVDTAGRSHKNLDQCNELLDLYNAIKQSETETELIPFLVLSATTRLKDMRSIIEVHKALGELRLIFTKLDETGCVGDILNIVMYSKLPVAYTTFGQNVPEDIKKLDAQAIAKQLLGGNE